MDPEDVLDFSEDDDGLDVISLGGSDHDGKPVSNHSASAIMEPAPRSIRQARPMSPSHSRRLRSPSHVQRNGSDRSLREASSRASNAPRGSGVEPKNQTVSRPADRSIFNTDRRLHESSFRDDHRSSVTEASRDRPRTDRLRLGERDSYMPPERLKAMTASSRSDDTSNSRSEPRRPSTSLSRRILDRFDTDEKVSTSLNTSNSATEGDKVEETKPIKKPVEAVVDPAAAELPEGWISRVSKGGKTYYVNALTRTSQWLRPDEPATGKPTKPTSKVASKTSSSQPAPGTTGDRTNHSLAHVQKLDIIDATDNSVTSRPEKQVLDTQASTHSQPLDYPSLKSRFSTKTDLPDDSLPVRRSEAFQHHENGKPGKDHYPRHSDLESQSTRTADYGVAQRSIPEEKLQHVTSESYLRDHRIHPDRRQEIAAANSHRARDRAPDTAQAISSFHRELPHQSNIRTREEPRRVESGRYPPESATFWPRTHPRPRSISPDNIRASSQRMMERRPRDTVQLSGANGIPTAPGWACVDRNLPHHPNTRTREEPRRGASDRYLQESDTFRPRAHPRPRSISPENICVSSHRMMERRPRDTVHLSGANGIPTAPGRSFPTTMLPRSSHEAYVDNEIPRYDKTLPFPSSSIEPNYDRVAATRPQSDHSMSRDMPFQDRGSSHWSPRGGVFVSPTHPPPRHRLDSRARSPAPPLRPFTSTLPDAQRAPFQPDLYPSERSRPFPAPNRALDEDRPTKPSEARDVLHRSTNSRYDAYRPSSLLSSETDVHRLHDSRRGSYPQRDKGGHRPELGRVEPRKSEMTRPSNLPEPPKILPGMSQPDLYRPSPRSAHAPRLSPRRTHPGKYYPIIDLDDIPSNSEGPPRPSTHQSTHRRPPNRTSSTDAAPETSQQSLQPPPIRSEDHNSSNRPTKRLANLDSDINNKLHGQNQEVEDINAKDVQTSSDIIEISQSQVEEIINSPKQNKPLSKRLAPHESCPARPEKLAPPPAKKHKQNPDEMNRSGDIHTSAENSHDFSVTRRSSLDKKTASNLPNSPRTSQNRRQSTPDTLPDSIPPSSEVHQDKIISLRGRAARKSEQSDFAGQPKSKIEEAPPMGNGSLRDRIQDLNFPSTPPLRSRLPSYYDARNRDPKSPEPTYLQDTHQARSRFEEPPPSSRHISERISGLHLPLGPPSPNRSHRSRLAPRQRDSGWSGRKARYS